MKRKSRRPIPKKKAVKPRRRKGKSGSSSKVTRIVTTVVLVCIALASSISIGLWYKREYERGVALYKSYMPAFAPGDTVQEYSSPSLDDSFNLLLVGLDRKDSGHIKSDAVLLAHYDPSSQSFQIIGLPVKTYYYDDLEERWLRLSDVYAVGQLRTPEQGMMYLRNVVEDALALNLDGYVAADFSAMTALVDTLGKLVVQNEEGFSDDDLGVKGFRETFDQGVLRLSAEEALAYTMADDGGYLSQVNRFYSVLSAAANSYSKPLAYRAFSAFEDVNNHVYSNLSGDSIREILALVEQQNALVLSTYTPTDIVSSREINDSILTTFDQEKFDKFVVSIFENQEILKEQARIEMYNGTSTGGLASKYSRRVRNFGGDVIRISNKSGDYESTIIFAPDSTKFPKTISRLGAIFPNAQVIEDYPHFTVTGDITILLAEDAIDG